MGGDSLCLNKLEVDGGQNGAPPSSGGKWRRMKGVVVKKWRHPELEWIRNHEVGGGGGRQIAASVSMVEMKGLGPKWKVGHDDGGQNSASISSLWAREVLERTTSVSRLDAREVVNAEPTRLTRHRWLSPIPGNLEL
jgi:hypothetical protein